MRILHVAESYRPMIGGIEVFVEDLAARQAAVGHDVSVLTTTRGREDAGPVRVLREPRTVLHPLASPRARQTAVRGGFDVVHAHLSVLSPFATTVARAADDAGVPTVASVHSMWGDRRAVVGAVAALADWEHSTLRWTAVSRAAARDVGRILSRDTEVAVVGNAVDVDWWRAGGTSRGAREAVTFVSVMRLAVRKRPLQLVDMLAGLPTSTPEGLPVRSVIVGAGPLERQVRAAVHRLGLDDRVILTGSLSRTEIRALCASADVYVAPAHQESFGIAALEARAAGLPVVAMRSGGVGEFVEDGVEGILCRDDAEMTSVLRNLALRSSLREGLARHNRARAPVHDWPLTLAGFDSAYSSAKRLTTVGNG